MGRYAAFLRGINLGRRRVTGPELCAPFTSLGFEEVASFLASGNVVFHTPTEEHPEALSEVIENALEEALGFEVTTFLRSDRDLHRIVAHEPFTAAAYRRSSGKLQVLLLPREPDAAARAEVLAHATDEDRLDLTGRELYWLPSGGVSQTALDLAAIERSVGPGTMRTANTITRLTARFFASD
jgi:uncharacterized protein (DUF1697 family)